MKSVFDHSDTTATADLGPRNSVSIMAKGGYYGGRPYVYDDQKVLIISLIWLNDFRCFYFQRLIIVPLLGKGLPILIPNLSILGELWHWLPRKHDQIIAPPAPQSTSTAMSSLRYPVSDSLRPPLWVHSCDVARPLPLQFGCFDSNISHLSNGAQHGVSYSIRTLGTYYATLHRSLEIKINKINISWDNLHMAIWSPAKQSLCYGNQTTDIHT